MKLLIHIPPSTTVNVRGGRRISNRDKALLCCQNASVQVYNLSETSSFIKLAKSGVVDKENSKGTKWRVVYKLKHMPNLKSAVSLVHSPSG